MMKLSEAIRLGAMLHPQNFGGLATYRDALGHFCGYSRVGAKVSATCALGAAKQAGYDIGQILGSAVVCRGVFLTCPHDNCEWEAPLTALVAHLNDGHRWTRERIADWVEIVERSLEDVSPGRDDVCVVSESEALTRS